MPVLLHLPSKSLAAQLQFLKRVRFSTIVMGESSHTEPADGADEGDMELSTDGAAENSAEGVVVSSGAVDGVDEGDMEFSTDGAAENSAEGVAVSTGAVSSTIAITLTLP